MFYREIFMHVVEIELNVGVLFKYWFVHKKCIKWDVYVNGIVCVNLWNVQQTPDCVEQSSSAYM